MYWDGTGLMEDNKIYIILFICSRAEENVKNELLLIPRFTQHQCGDGQKNKYRRLQMYRKVTLLSHSCSLHISQARVAIHICPDPVNVYTCDR